MGAKRMRKAKRHHRGMRSDELAACDGKLPCAEDGSCDTVCTGGECDADKNLCNAKAAKRMRKAKAAKRMRKAKRHHRRMRNDELAACDGKLPCAEDGSCDTVCTGGECDATNKVCNAKAAKRM